MSKSLAQLIMLEMNKISKFPLLSTWFSPYRCKHSQSHSLKVTRNLLRMPFGQNNKRENIPFRFLFWVGNERGYVFNFVLILEGISVWSGHHFSEATGKQSCMPSDRQENPECHSQTFWVTSKKSKRCPDSLLQRHHYFHSRKPLPYGVLEHQRFDLILFNFMNNHRTNILCFTLKKIPSQIILYLPLKKNFWNVTSTRFVYEEAEIENLSHT